MPHSSPVCAQVVLRFRQFPIPRNGTRHGFWEDRLFGVGVRLGQGTTDKSYGDGMLDDSYFSHASGGRTLCMVILLASIEI